MIARGPASSRTDSPVSALDLFDRMVEWIRRRHPEWQASAEDPATIILEVWAEMESELRAELSRVESRTLDRFLDALQIEQREPSPARGVVQFSLSEPTRGAGVERVPALTRVSAPRRNAEPRIVFETECDCSVNHGSLVRAFATTRTGFQVLRCFSGSERGARQAPVRPFGSQANPERYIYVGDGRLEALREGASVTLEWGAGTGHYPSDFEWEYHGSNGWCRLPARFELESTSSGSVLRMRIDGSLHDLRETTIESACLPWLRAGLPGDETVELSVPILRVGDAEEFVARCFAHSGSGFEDLSFSSECVQLAPVQDALQPTLFLGLDAAIPVSFFVEIEDGLHSSAALLASNPAPPQLAWEYATAEGWKSLAPEQVHDRTGGLSRSGTVHLKLNEDMRGVSIFDERLVWVRARWLDGRFVHVPAITAIHCNAVEVVQGITLRDQILSPVGGEWRGWIPVPDFPEGTARAFDHVVVKKHGREETRSRVSRSDAGALPEHGFVLRRQRDGNMVVRFESDDGAGGAPHPQCEVRIASVRVGMETCGNLPEGSLSRVDHDGASLRVEQIGPTTGGEDLESIEQVRRRAAFTLRSDDRAVTRADYENLAYSMIPDVSHVHASPDPLHSPGVLVELVLGSDRAVSVAELASLERFLGDLSVPGTSVRVTHRTLQPAALEVIVASTPESPRGDRFPDSSLADLASELERVLRARRGSENKLPALGIKAEDVEQSLRVVLPERRDWSHLVLREARIVSESGAIIQLTRVSDASSERSDSDMYYDLGVVRVQHDRHRKAGGET